MRPALLAVTALVLAGCEQSAPLEPMSPQLSSALGGSNRSFRYTTIDVPGSRATAASGINAAGHVVGQYVDAGFVTHAFLLRDGVFTTIDYPGAEGTQARGIGPAGEIVGTYWLPGEPAVNIHGFLLTTDGEFVPVDHPGHTNTIPQRILPDGTILGCRHDDDTMGSMKGIVIGTTGELSEIDAFASMHNGATPDLRRIAGLYTNMMTGQTEGYLIDDGEFTPFIVPGSNFTAAWDVNPAGEVAGIYRNATGFHGFVRTARDYVTIDVPGAAATRAFGINAGGDVVGSYVAGGRTFGFLASATRQHDL